jgi:hypothetical protein
VTDHFPLMVPGSKTASPAREGRRVMCCAPSGRQLELLVAARLVADSVSLRFEALSQPGEAKLEVVLSRGRRIGAGLALTSELYAN